MDCLVFIGCSNMVTGVHLLASGVLSFLRLLIYIGQAQFAFVPLNCNCLHWLALCLFWRHCVFLLCTLAGSVKISHLQFEFCMLKLHYDHSMGISLLTVPFKSAC